MLPIFFLTILHIVIIININIRDEFRVCLVSQLPVTEINQYLFAETNKTHTDHMEHSNKTHTDHMEHSNKTHENYMGLSKKTESALPNRDYFTVIVVEYSDI